MSEYKDQAEAGIMHLDRKTKKPTAGRNMHLDPVMPVSAIECGRTLWARQIILVRGGSVGVRRRKQ